MALPSERESLNRLVGFAAAANRRRKNQAKTPTTVNSDPSAIQVKSFEEAMNVAMTAIIGGPSRVAKDFSTLQTLAKSPNNIYGIINSQKDIVNNINETLKDVSGDIKSVIENITDISIQTQFLEGIAESIDTIVEKLNKKKNKGDKVQLIQLAAGDANVGNLLKSLQDFDEKSLKKVEKIVTELNKLNTIDLSKFKENIQVLDDDVIKNLSEKFDGIKDLYENHVAAAADAATKGQQDLKTINKTNEETTEVIIEGKKPTNKQLEEAKTSYEGLAEAILAGAFVMMIGALIIRLFPQFPEHALKFAAVLTLFITAVMAPLVLADIIMSKWGGKGKTSFEGIGDIIATAAAVMIIGALFMLIPGLSDKALEFTKQLAIFFIATFGALAIVSHFVKPQLLSSLGDFSRLIIVSAIVMIIGAFFMKIDWLPKNALKFGLTLGLFIAVVLGPLMLLSFIGGNRQMKHNLEGVSKLIITCTVIMMIGALFMLLDNGSFVKNALIFGLVLSLFIALVLLPLLILKPLIGIAEHTLRDVTRLIIVCTIIMMVGALFIMLGGGKFVRAAMTFAIILTFFITLCILPILLLKPFIHQGLRLLRDVTLFVMVATIIMLIGAFLILNHPEYIIASLKFGLILALFITSTILPVIALGLFTRRAITEIGKIALFIAISAAVMLAGAYFMKKGYGLAAIGFTIVFGIFVVSMIGIMYILSRIGKWLNESVENAAMLGVATTFLSIAFGIMGVSMKLLTAEDFIQFLICTTLIAAIFAILGSPFLGELVGFGAIVAEDMGIALTSLSIAFAILHISMMISDPLSDFQKLMGALLLAGLVFGALGLLAPLIYEASISAGAMGISLSILSISFVILHYAMTFSEPLEDFMKLSLALIAAGIVFAELGALSLLIVFGSIAASTMSLSLMLLSAAFRVLHICVGADGINPKDDFGKLDETIWEAGKTFAKLAFLTIFIIPGSIAAAAMSGALMLVSLAFEKASNIVTTYPNIGDDLNKIDIAIAICGGLFAALGALSGLILAGSVVAIIMTNVLKQIALSFLLVHFIVNPKDQEGNKIDYNIIDDLVNLGLAIGLIGGIFSAVALLSIPIAIASPIITGMSIALTAFSLSLILMKHAVDLANEIQIADSTGENLEKFFGLFDSFPNVVEIAILYSKIGLIFPLINAMTFAIGKIANTVKNVAEMKIPTEWNEHGDPIGYRHFTDQDFTNASANIQTIISTVSNALIKLYNNKPELFDDGEDSTIFTVLRATMYMGLVISFITKSLQGYANLMIPDKWNSDGNPIHFSLMDKEDFKNAAEGIKIIISTLGKAIIQFINDNPKLVEYMGEAQKGFLGLGSSPSKFAMVCMSGKTIGDLISGIAQGLTSYANMLYPVHWNADGHPDKFQRLDDTMILEAKLRIIDILTDMTIAIAEAYDRINSTGFFSGIFNSPERVKAKIECFTSVGSIITSIAEGLANYAALMIPDQWNKDGRPTHFYKMTDKEIEQAKLNIVDIMSSMSEAVANAYDMIPVSSSDLKNMIESFIPIGELISGFSNGLQSYAKLLVPTKWNKDGAAVAYTKLTDADIQMAAVNIGIVMTTMATAVWDAYNNFQEGKDVEGNPIGMKPEDIKKVIEGFKPISDIVANTATGLQAYTTLMIPDKWDKDGKPIHFTKLPDDFFDKAAINIGTIILTTAWALQNLYKKNTDLFEGKNPEINKTIEFGKGIADIINGVATGLHAYANLLIPTDWDKDGKPIKFRQMIDTDITKAKANIQLLISSMAEALCMASSNPYVMILTTPGNNQVDSISDLTKTIMDIVSNSCEMVNSLANLKVPTGFDKDGKATGYLQISDQIIANMKNNMKLLLTAIPEVIVNTCINGEHAEWYKTTIPESERDIVNSLNSTGTILDAVVNNVQSLIDSESVEAINNVFNYKGHIKPSNDDKETLGLFLDIKTLFNNYITLFNYITTKFSKVEGTSGLDIAQKVITKQGQLLSTLLENTNTITEQMKSISFNGIDLSDSTTLEESLTTTLTNVTDIYNKLYNIFANSDLTKLEHSNNLFKNENDTEKANSNIIQNISTLHDIVEKLTKTANSVKQIKGDEFNNIGLALDNLNGYVKTINNNALTNYAKEVETTEKFVKAIGSIKLNNTMALTKLLEQMVKLSEHMGDLDKFTKVLSEQLASTLTQLTKQIRDAQRTIKDADRIQRQRHELIDNSIAKVQKMMESTLQVNVTSTSSGAETTTEVTEETRE